LPGSTVTNSVDRLAEDPRHQRIGRPHLCRRRGLPAIASPLYVDTSLKRSPALDRAAHSASLRRRAVGHHCRWTSRLTQHTRVRASSSRRPSTDADQGRFGGQGQQQLRCHGPVHSVGAPPRAVAAGWPTTRVSQGRRSRPPRSRAPRTTPAPQPDERGSWPDAAGRSRRAGRRTLRASMGPTRPPGPG
jgi:hypothetical protein